MTIGGGPAPGGKVFDVVDPATGKPFAVAPECTPELLDQAMEAARKAFPQWQADEGARRAALREAAAVLQGNVEELAALLTAEQGKPLIEAGHEVFGAALWLDHHADAEMPHEVVHESGEARVEVRRRPLGVVAAITPWNFPLALAAWKLGPALLTGNTVVLKPPPYTPLTTLRLGELLREVFPPGVLNVVSGGDELGAAMVAHPVPRKVSLTGSVATGKRVAAAAGADLKRLTLELGGNDAAIVLDDADPATVAEAVVTGAFANCGQVCTAIKRVYVPERRSGEFLDALAGVVGRLRIGNGAERGTTLGPLCTQAGFVRIGRLVDEASARGAQALTGGRALGGDGHFYPPTILTGVPDDARIVTEEQFGPALPVLTYRDEDEAVARANDTMFGLSGSVWGTDADRAEAVALRLQAGTTYVNTHFDMVGPEQPIGGIKWSGLGVEHGRWGLEGFTDLHVVHRA
ncbi:aldehyde dehydrogenase family protein [Nonomuraea sp. SYSU D8015]|uniref:aldehyde dehydrogenase family protein n=1 Tax=Nonomuraea sp. SYSU D8015 TaxID=2593644 RepID=UPI001660C626|nr:aldehyde dehydrogenase family protein [Nonomuraea sp. SYSU D8015]